MIYKIKNEYASAEIDSLGAELKSYKNNEGTEFIWQPYGDFWKGTSPVLFPIVGRLRNGKTFIEGKEYKMNPHGFAKVSEFEVESKSDSNITFAILFNNETLSVYPYKFKLLISFILEKSKLITKYEVINADDKPIIFAVGGHTAFKCPVKDTGKFHDYILEFSEAENASCPYTDKDCMILTKHRRLILDNTNILGLNHSLFDNDALIFDDLKSKSVKLYSESTGKGIVMNFNDFPYFAVWTQNGANAPFICLEPWTGMGFCEDENDNLEEKRGMQKLPVGENYIVSFDMDFI